MNTVDYSESEEKINILSHATGIVLSVVGLVLMLVKSNSYTSIVSSVAFGISLILLYTASTLYHSSKDYNRRAKLRVFDHAAIYVLIAGTYTPVCLITLKDNIGFILLSIIWGIAICGIIFKLFFTGKFDKISTVMYVSMGWVAIFGIKSLLQTMSASGLIWLAIGGFFYTIGAILYSIKSLLYNHAIFHFFVLGGSGSHFIMIYFFVI